MLKETQPVGTSLSAITFLAIPAKAYQTDWVYLLGNLMIVAVAPPVIWYYLPFYRRLKVTSAYEYLELRFGLAARLVGSATFLLFQLGRMGIVVYLPALALSTVSGWNIYACIVAIGLLATFYTTLGGIEAVIWTDVVQVVVLLGGVAIARIATVLLGIVGTLTAVWLAWLGTKSVWDQFLKIMGLFGGGLAGMFVAGIFTRRVHQAGVLIGLAVSAVTLYAVSTSGTVHFFLYGAIGILTCSVGGWLASAAIPGPNQDLIGLTVPSLNRDADGS